MRHIIALLSMIVETHCFDNKVICCLLSLHALESLLPVDFEEKYVLKVQLLNSLLCNPLLYAM